MAKKSHCYTQLLLRKKNLSSLLYMTCAFINC